MTHTLKTDELKQGNAKNKMTTKSAMEASIVPFHKKEFHD